MSPGEATVGWQSARGVMRLVDKFLIAVTGIALVVLTLMITFDVGTRFVLNRPLPATTEISELLMPYIVFLTMGYTLSLGVHIRITVLFEYIPARWKDYLDILADVLGTGFCAIVTYHAWIFFAHSYSIREEMLAVVHLPWYAGKLAMPVGFLVFTLHYAVHLVETATRIWNGASAGPPRLSEPSSAKPGSIEETPPQRRSSSGT